MHVLLPSWTESEEGDESQKSVLARKLGYICHTYNAALNGRLENDSCQGQLYEWYYTSLECSIVYTNGLNSM